MARICLGMLTFRCKEDSTDVKSTPKKLDEALPNKERGIFHIQDASYWAFYNLE